MIHKTNKITPYELWNRKKASVDIFTALELSVISITMERQKIIYLGSGDPEWNKLAQRNSKELSRRKDCIVFSMSHHGL